MAKKPPIATEQPVKAEVTTEPKPPTVPKLEPEWQKNIRERAKGQLRHPVKLEKDSADPTKLTLNLGPQEILCRMFETTGFLDDDAAEHLTYQIANINTRGNNNELVGINASLAIMNGIAPEMPLEGILAAQMTVAHNMAMDFSRRAMADGATSEVVDRNVNRAAKMMRTFTAQVDALQKLRNKGQQKITVQHVQVSEGGQAIIGDVTQGGGNRG